MFTILTNVINAVAQLQLESCKSCQHLVQYLRNSSHHNYPQNHIKFISSQKFSTFKAQKFV